MKKLKYKRVLIKISGASIGSSDGIFNTQILENISRQLIKLSQEGLEIAIVVGGGNIWRGADERNNFIDRVHSDYIGMLATVMNALVLEASIKKLGYDKVIVASALEINKITEPFYYKKVMSSLSKKNICILPAGLGHPYFTTDTAAALRGVETKVDVILMAKNKVNGVYNKDPNKDKNAKFIKNLNLTQLINLKLKVMDQTAASLALTANLGMVVFNIKEKNSIYLAAHGEGELTNIKGD